jgi:hypothetical protein
MLEHLSTPIPNAQSKNIACAASCAGGLLLSVVRSDAAVLRDALKSAGVSAVETGEVLAPGSR